MFDMNFLRSVTINDGKTFRDQYGYCAKGAWYAALGLDIPPAMEDTAFFLLSLEEKNRFNNAWKAMDEARRNIIHNQVSPNVWDKLTVIESKLNGLAQFERVGKITPETAKELLLQLAAEVYPEYC